MSTKENTTTEGFVSRVIASLKGGDEGKLKRFHGKVIKHLNDQIRIRETEVTELHEKGIDLQEEYAEAVLSVNFDRIATTDGAKDYAIEYAHALLNYESDINGIDSQSKDLTEEIEKFQAIVNKLGKA